MPVPAVFALDGVIRHYAWGSRSAIPELLGIEPDGAPAAELWFGAHPHDPSPAPDHGTTLDALIAAAPDELLGAATVRQFGSRLPFLLKVLAVETALSIQVHPSAEQARAGCAAEDAAGIARDAPDRNYRDPNHKPELLCALTPFEALCGFRPLEDTLRLLDRLDVAGLARYRDLLTGPGGLRAAFTELLMLAPAGQRHLADAVLPAASRLDGDDEWAGVARAVRLVAADFPGDVGVVLGLLLNHVRLEPGEAIFLGAGTVHCYLRGTGVEVMANSDNVLRCGLTPKHVDVPEVLKVTDFTSLTEPRYPAEDSGFGPSFAPPVPDFALSVIDIDADEGSRTVGGHGPYVVLCAEGRARVDPVGTSLDLRSGQAAFVAAREAAFTVRGTGRMFAATIGTLD